MSMTESKAPTKGKTTRPAKTTKKNALTEKIEAALAKAVRKTATLGQLVLTDLNVRKKKSSQVSIEGLAAAIRSAGLLMNLAVFEMDDGRYGVVAGERRTLAQQVAEDEGWSWAEGRISAIKMWGRMRRFTASWPNLSRNLPLTNRPRSNVLKRGSVNWKRHSRRRMPIPIPTC